MNIEFTGQQALVTGGGGGIGKEIAKLLLQCGAEVIALDVNKDALEALKNEQPSIQTIAVDVADWKATRSALEGFDNISLLVNCAGIAYIENMLDLPEEDVNKLFDINIKAVILLTQIVANNLMSKNKPGAVVNISSQTSLSGMKGHCVYGSTKGAVDAYTRAAALELGPHNIRVNTVNPTIIMTDMGRQCWSDPERADPVLARIPLGRFGEVHEVANVVVFLLSDKASLITGTCLPVDGGFTAI